MSSEKYIGLDVHQATISVAEISLQVMKSQVPCSSHLEETKALLREFTLHLL